MDRETERRAREMKMKRAERGLIDPSSHSLRPTIGNSQRLLVGDVGQDNWEEMDVLTGGGGNYGWRK